MIQICDLRHFFLDPVQTVTAGVDCALPVAHGDVLEAGGQQQLDDGDGGSARAGGDDLHVLLLLADHLQRVGQTGQGDDGGTVLVVVEDGNVAPFLQLPLDLKAPGSRDILQIDAAKGTGDQGNGIDELVHILGLHAQRERVHIGKGLEQSALALHNGHTGLGADVAQAQNGGAVGDNGAQVVPPGQGVGLIHILLNFQAGLGNAGGVGQGQIVLGLAGHLADDFDLAAPLLVKPQGLFCVIHCLFLRRSPASNATPSPQSAP
ncbi:uncharacterized protein BN466_01697 [Firmicutes bacterium CAG:110]|nr:uncharacterized protein BN466_01697 [Firmicutes bacterium CAG:110]